MPAVRQSWQPGNKGIGQVERDERILRELAGNSDNMSGGH